MNFQLLLDSFVAFHKNAASRIAYGVSTNWWLLILIVATIISVILGIIENSEICVREEQNIL